MILFDFDVTTEIYTFIDVAYCAFLETSYQVLLYRERKQKKSLVNELIMTSGREIEP